MISADEILIMSCIKLCSFAGIVDEKPVGGKSPDLIKAIQKKYIEKLFGEVGEIDLYKKILG